MGPSTALTSALALAVLLSPLLQPASSGVICSSGSFRRGDEAKVTCHFNRNINDMQHNFNVVHYARAKSDSPTDAGTYVLLCNWGASRNLECKVEDGYSFNNQVSDELTVSTPNVTSDAEGMYVCQLVPDDGNQVKTCNLTVIDCPPTDSVTKEEEESQNPRYDILAAVVIVVSVLLAITVVILVIHMRVRRKNSHHTAITYALDASEKPINSSKAGPGRKAKNIPTHGKDEEDEMLPMRSTVQYSPNAIHMPTQTYVVVVDKELQIGSPAPQTAEKQTRVTEKDIPKEKNIKPDTEGLKQGSAKRYNTQTVTYLGKPPVIPVTKDPTPQDIERATYLATNAMSKVKSQASPETGSTEKAETDKQNQMIENQVATALVQNVDLTTYENLKGENNATKA